MGLNQTEVMQPLLAIDKNFMESLLEELKNIGGPNL